MRKIVLFAIVVFLLVCQCAWATGKITVDPNASDQSVIQEWDSDARLAQKVTYEARHKSVKVILADLSDMTGVMFNAGYNKQDWQVRDRKMNIFAKDITLADLMSSIARTMKFKWSVNKDFTPWTYRIYMDRKTLAAANAELSKAEKDYDETIAKRRADFADMIENWDDDLSDDELASLRKDNPYLYWMHTHGAGAAVKGLFNDVPGLKENFLNQERDMYYPISALSDATKQQVLETAKKLYLVNGLRYAGKGEPFPEDAEKAFNTGRMWFDFVPDELGWGQERHRKYAGIGLYVGDVFFGMEPYLGDPANPGTQLWAELELQVCEKNISIGEIWEQNETEFQNMFIEESKMREKVFPTEPQLEIADEPDLHKIIKVEPEKKRWLGLDDYQAAIAKASGFAVVSDSYKITDGYSIIGSNDMELQDALKTLCEGYRYNWDKHGSVIELRSKEWFRKRTTQIPDEWVEKWRANLKKLGYMPIDDYAQIAQLTSPQILENLGTDENFYNADMFDSAYANQISLIRLYASLSDTQKSALYSTMGLSVMSFNANQWDLLRKACKNFAVEYGKTSGMLTCSMLKKEKEGPEYTFRLINLDDGSELERWVAKMFTYKEPPKPESEPPKAQDKKSESTAQPATDSQTKTK